MLFVCGVLPYFTKKEVVKHAVLAQGAGHFWTVPVEMKFYILVPILFAILSKCNKRTRIFVLSCVAALLAFIFPYVSYVENSIRIVWYLPVFIIGMITAELYEEKSVQINSRVAGVGGCSRNKSIDFFYSCGWIFSKQVSVFCYCVYDSHTAFAILAPSHRFL